MTEAGWTRNAPTKEGWYWWRNLLTDNAPEVWAIVDHGDGLEVIGPFDETALDEWVSDMGGEWLGPITPDDRQQGRVAGLREGLGVVNEAQQRDRDDATLESLIQQIEAKIEQVEK